MIYRGAKFISLPEIPRPDNRLTASYFSGRGGKPRIEILGYVRYVPLGRSFISVLGESIKPRDVSRYRLHRHHLTGAIKSAVFSIIRCMIVPAPVTVFFQREKQRSTVPPVHITDRPGGNIHAVIITGRSGAAESEEVRRVGNEALTGRAESRIGKSRADIQPDRKYLQMINNGSVNNFLICYLARL